MEDTKYLKQVVDRYVLLEREAETLEIRRTSGREKLRREITKLSHLIDSQTNKLQKLVNTQKTAKGIAKRLRRECSRDAIFYLQNRNDHALLFDLRNHFTFSNDLVKLIHGYCCVLQLPLLWQFPGIPDLYSCQICRSIGLERYRANTIELRDQCRFCGCSNAGILVCWKRILNNTVPNNYVISCQDCFYGTGYFLHSCEEPTCHICHYNKRNGYLKLTNLMRYYDASDIVATESLLCHHTFKYKSSSALQQACSLTYPDSEKALKISGVAHMPKVLPCDICKKWVAKCQYCAWTPKGQSELQKIVHDHEITACIGCAEYFFMSRQMINKYTVNLMQPRLFGAFYRWNPDVCSCYNDKGW